MQFGTVSSAPFEWTIPTFRELKRKNNYILSPEFHRLDCRWYLSLHFASNEWVHIRLCRKDSGAPKTITYTIKINGRSDAEFTNTDNFERENPLSGGARIILKKEIASDSNIYISCYMKCDTREPTPAQPVAERKFVTCAVQTEVTKSEKENPKDQDWSSLDMKGVALLSERMKELLIKGIEQDITICVQDKKFRAHRIILSARSPVFAMMLNHDTKEKNTSTINIEDCDPESFGEFLLYVYCGRTENLTPSNALQLDYPADKYDFPVLKQRCVSILKTSLSVESICDVVLLAAKHQEKELLEVATEFFARNVKEILVTVGWQNFMSQNPVQANELYIKTMEILHPVN